MKTKLGILASACVLLASASVAQAAQDVEPPSTPAPIDASASGESGGGGGDGKAAQSTDLAKTLTNPIGALISVPFQSNWDYGGGPAGKGSQFRLNLQPIVPIPLS